MLVNLKEILDKAKDGGYAVPAFNVYNMETAMGILAAAEETNAPIIMQTYSRLFTNEEGYYVAAVALAAAKAAKVPICYHLDHGASKNEAIKALRYGATGIMIDKSELSMEENIAYTNQVCEMCNVLGVPVEGEIGHVGTVNDEQMGDYTTVEEAKAYVDATGVCALAVAVGTAHGRYKKEPKLDIDRIEEISKAIDAHVVLHGGSGIPDDAIKAAIKAGIRKINFGTDVCYAFLDKVFETSRDKIAVDIFMKDAIQNVKAFGIEKIKLLGAENKAW